MRKSFLSPPRSLKFSVGLPALTFGLSQVLLPACPSTPPLLVGKCKGENLKKVAGR